jgi:phospholipid N-methyltransferase
MVLLSLKEQIQIHEIQKDHLRVAKATQLLQRLDQTVSCLTCQVPQFPLTVQSSLWNRICMKQKQHGQIFLLQVTNLLPVSQMLVRSSKRQMKLVTAALNSNY